MFKTILKHAVGFLLLLVASAAHAQVSSPINGYDSGSSTGWVLNTPNSSSHAAGSAVGCDPSTCSGNQGGLWKLPVARLTTTDNNGGTGGLITSFMVKFTGGTAATYQFRMWDKAPTTTTCKDQTAFSGDATDDLHLIALFTAVSIAPTNTTGDSNVYINLTGLSIDYKSQDTTPTGYVYVCMQATATDTADESAAIYMMASGPRN